MNRARGRGRAWQEADWLDLMLQSGFLGWSLITKASRIGQSANFNQHVLQMDVALSSTFHVLLVRPNTFTFYFVFSQPTIIIAIIIVMLCFSSAILAVIHLKQNVHKPHTEVFTELLRRFQPPSSFWDWGSVTLFFFTLSLLTDIDIRNQVTFLSVLFCCILPSFKPSQHFSCLFLATFWVWKQCWQHPYTWQLHCSW